MDGTRSTRWGSLALVAPLVFGSGATALVYQIAWMRELRLVFGASTAASAVVLAVFIGGLGAGGLWFGGRADRHLRPLSLYAALETGVALAATASPWLLDATRAIYVAAGGEVALGRVGGASLRLVLAALVLGLPTFLMGGTLAAAVGAVEEESDWRRRAVATLYGTNTLGAVLGAFVATFVLLERLGTRRTLWLAAAANLLLALFARRIAERLPTHPAVPADPAGDERADEDGRPGAPPAFVFFAALFSGFVFFLMEIVWYRLLGPLLGGSVYTFGLILVLALFGIGLGGAISSLVGTRRPATLAGFGWTCLLEGIALALPFALGDHLALLALSLRTLGAEGFWGLVFGWGVVGGVVIVPGAMVSGIQFPMLIALLGRGRRSVGRQIGLAYAWNTVGAIAGALAGGFGLLPLLTAPGCWRLASLLLGALGLASLLASLRGDPSRPRALAGAAAATLVLSFVLAQGPTAVWRHSHIGVGRVPAYHLASSTALRDWMRYERRAIGWEVDGVESSVALHDRSGLAVITNGKVDGHARLDAPTNVMSGLVAAALHPQPKRALVVGLATGATAGWLARVDSIAQVDVVELEPAMLEVARRMAAVNAGVLDNPKVRIRIGDAREVLLGAGDRYDIVFSEPSNPYRAGVASLFTRELYASVRDRLEPGGVFVQWIQAYETDGRTLRTIYATLADVFPHVETWQSQKADLLLVAAARPIGWTPAAVRERLARAPWPEALVHTWRTDHFDGFFARYLAGPELARRIAAEGAAVNTDDRNLVEFGFARSVGKPQRIDAADIVRAAHRLGDEGALALPGVDRDRIEEERLAILASEGIDPPNDPSWAPDRRARAAALSRWITGDLVGALAAWRRQGSPARGVTELALVAETLAEAGDEKAEVAITHLERLQSTEAAAFRARYELRRGRLEEAEASLLRAFRRYRTDPWPLPFLMERSLALTLELGQRRPDAIERLYEALGARFAVSLIDEARLATSLSLLSLRPQDRRCVDALAAYEPQVPWRRDLLAWRVSCYEKTGSVLLAEARRELAGFMAGEAIGFEVP